MKTKKIGNIGEAKVIAKFVELGIPVYIPFGDNEKSDLIAEFNGKLNKIQVKTSIKAENGKMVFNISSSTLHRKNGVKHVYTHEEVDYFALYNIQRDVILLFSIDEVSNYSVVVRYEDTKNKQKIGVKYEQDYLIDKVILEV